ncbi:hypothetical protein ACJJTC_017297 [Scirpophaga incertulas]
MNNAAQTPAVTIIGEEELMATKSLMAAANGPEGPARKKKRRGKETPVVAVSNRTKAKTDATELAPNSAGQTPLEEVIELLKNLFVAAISGESLTTVAIRGLKELWQLFRKTWTPN